MTPSHQNPGFGRSDHWQLCPSPRRSRSHSHILCLCLGHPLRHPTNWSLVCQVHSSSTAALKASMEKVSLARALWFAVWRSLMVEGGPLHNCRHFTSAHHAAEKKREREESNETRTTTRNANSARLHFVLDFFFSFSASMALKLHGEKREQVSVHCANASSFRPSLAQLTWIPSIKKWNLFGG